MQTLWLNLMARITLMLEEYDLLSDIDRLEMCSQLAGEVLQQLSSINPAAASASGGLAAPTPKHQAQQNPAAAAASTVQEGTVTLSLKVPGSHRFRSTAQFIVRVHARAVAAVAVDGAYGEEADLLSSFTEQYTQVG